MRTLGSCLRLFLSAAAFFLSSNWTFSLQSQCASHSPTENGAGAWRANEGGGYSPVVGNPYTAVIHHENQFKSSDGTIEFLEGDTTEARDSSGRTYHEVTMRSVIAGHQGTRVSASVMDPVCGLLIEWDTDSKVATITHMVWSPSLQKDPRWLKPAVPETRNRNGVQTKVEDLGTRMFLGVKALGVRYTSIVPAGSSSHNDNPVVVTSENWVSPDLETFVELKSDNPFVSMVHNHSLMIHLDRTEPYSELFRIPADYTIKDHYVDAQP